MRSTAHFLRALIISPETCFTLGIVLLSLFLPNLFESIGTKFRSDQELWKYLVGLPIPILAWAVLWSKDILFPLKDSNRALIEWPDYWKLKIRVIVALLLLLFTGTIALGLWIFKNEMSPRVIGSLFIIVIIVSVVDAATIWLATINIRQIAEK